MRITKFGHACVRLETAGRAIVLDPGGFTDPEAVDGATAVLITHEHPDHYSAQNLRRTDALIYTIAAVAKVIGDEAPDLTERVTVVAPGASFDPGVPTTVVGEKHAIIHPEMGELDNSGYLLEVDGTRIYHPGDSLILPDGEVDLLLLPVSAPWLKFSECLDFARSVGAARSLGIHDMIYSEAGLGFVGGHLERMLAQRGQEYVRIEPGQDL